VLTPLELAAAGLVRAPLPVDFDALREGAGTGRGEDVLTPLGLAAAGLIGGLLTVGVGPRATTGPGLSLFLLTSGGNSVDLHFLPRQNWSKTIGGVVCPTSGSEEMGGVIAWHPTVRLRTRVPAASRRPMRDSWLDCMTWSP
jgi:hypothetical protein